MLKILLFEIEYLKKNSTWNNNAIFIKMQKLDLNIFIKTKLGLIMEFLCNSMFIKNLTWIDNWIFTKPKIYKNLRWNNNVIFIKLDIYEK